MEKTITVAVIVLPNGSVVWMKEYTRESIDSYIKKWRTQNQEYNNLSIGIVEIRMYESEYYKITANSSL